MQICIIHPTSLQVNHKISRKVFGLNWLGLMFFFLFFLSSFFFFLFQFGKNSKVFIQLCSLHVIPSVLHRSLQSTENHVKQGTDNTEVKTDQVYHGVFFQPMSFVPI